MTSYPKEFPGIVGRLMYCINRNASCKNKLCSVCICDEDFVYYLDRDICDIPPVTTPARRVATSKSTVNRKLTETTTVTTSSSIYASSKSAVFSSSKPRTGFATNINTGPASILSSSSASTSSKFIAS